MIWLRPPWTAALVAVAALALGAVAPASASAAVADPCAAAPVTAPLTTNTNRLGIISLHFFEAQGARVSYFECAGGRSRPLGSRSSPQGTITVLLPATRWRCDRLARHFAATATRPDGSFARGAASVRTMSCAHRFDLAVPRRIAQAGEPACALSIAGESAPSARRCASARRERVPSVATWRLPRWRRSPRGASVRRRRGAGASSCAPPDTVSIAVGVRDVAPKAAPPTVLATGDSTMQGIDSFLSDELGDDATFVSDVRPGSSLSLGNIWWPIAATQAARVRPSSTEISIGANEGFPMRTADRASHACCDEMWMTEYARRVRKAMRSYRRDGRGRVYWLTIPAPRDDLRVPIFAAVNTAILRAASGLSGVRVLRMDRLFTPHGYREVIRYRGVDVSVREPDGIHLNVAGTRIAAQVIARALRER